MPRALGAALHRGGDFIQRGGGFLKAGRLLLGAPRQVVRGAGDFIRTAPQAGDRVQHLAQGLAQAFDRAVEVVLHPAVGAVHVLNDPRRQIARRQLRQTVGQNLDQRRLRRLGAQALGLAARGLLFGLGDVHRQFHDLHRAAVRPHDGIVGGLQPDLAPALGQTPELGGHEPARVQIAPEGDVGRAGRLGRVHESAVMLPADFVQAVAHGLQQIVVGVQDDAVQIEFDQGLGSADRGHLAVEIIELLLHIVLLTTLAEHPVRSLALDLIDDAHCP
ncbi:hypothetical protein D3C87_1344810 [compost metagenome]